MIRCLPCGLATVIRDPAYLTEPMIRTRSIPIGGRTPQQISGTATTTMTGTAKTTAVWVAAGLALAFVVAQVVRPELPHPPVTADLQAPPAVNRILRTSCYPCHSNESWLAWFDEMVPAYQLVAHDVKKARMHLNFSELGAQPTARQNAALFEALNHIQMGATPLPRYLLLHPEAAVTSTQLAVLRDYVLSVSAQYAGRTVEVRSCGFAISPMDCCFRQAALGA